MGYSIVDVATLEGAGPGGAVRFVRRELGVEAFGINWFELPAGTEGREHNEAGVGPGGGQRDRRRLGHVLVDGEGGARAPWVHSPLRPGDDAAAGRRPRRA